MNVSDKPLEKIEVECIEDSFGKPKSIQSFVKPNMFAPGAKGTYQLGPLTIWGRANIHVVFKQGGKELHAFNRFGAELARNIYEAAMKAYADTGLAYKNHDVKGQYLEIQFFGTERFNALSDNQKKDACDKALAEMSKPVSADESERTWPLVLEIFDPKTRKARWSYNSEILTTIVD
jgi:hypothetical protein